MLFGKNGQKQTQNAVNPQGTGTWSPAGEMGAGAAQQPAAPWAGGSGYPVQPSGTGYAGYTPDANQGPGAGYPGGAGAQNGYGQSGAYGQSGTYGQMPQGYTGWSQGRQGFGASGQMYAQPSQGYPQAGYGQTAQNTGAAAQGYAMPQGAEQPSAAYQMPQGTVPGYGMNAGQAPQGYGMNAGQPAQGYGMPQGGYTYPQAGMPQGYNAYAQMGRNQAPQQEMNRQIPLNGGGYVPPAVPVKKQPFVFQSWMLIALGAALCVLFAVGLFLFHSQKQSALLWLFLPLALGSTAFFWIRPLVTGNRRLCYTIIFGVLSLVALLSALGVLSPRTDTTRSPAGPAQTAAAQPASSGSGTVVVDPQTGESINAVEITEAPVTASPAQEDNSTQDRLESFFRFWSANRQDEMLSLCAPSWQSSVDNPKSALFGLMANRTPLDYMVEKVSGTSEDTSRTVTVTSTMDRNNGKDPVKYRLSVLMVKESGDWYVDPQSLKTYDEAETPDPALEATATPSPEPLVNGSTILYYNPDGGTKYHLDQNCKSTHAKYLPMKGHFTYAEINDEKYAGLSPCNVCAAPLRP